MTACFCCCSWFKKPKPPLSASHPTFEEVALELSLSQALSLQQTHRAFVHASCYIYLILPQVTVICILSTLVPTKVVTEQKKELLNCQPIRALKALRNHHLWLSSCRCRKAKGLALGHPGSLPPPQCWLFPLHQAASQIPLFGWLSTSTQRTVPSMWQTLHKYLSIKRCKAA